MNTKKIDVDTSFKKNKNSIKKIIKVKYFVLQHAWQFLLNNKCTLNSKAVRDKNNNAVSWESISFFLPDFSFLPET